MLRFFRSSAGIASLIGGAMVFGMLAFFGYRTQVWRSEPQRTWERQRMAACRGDFKSWVNWVSVREMAKRNGGRTTEEFLADAETEIRRGNTNWICQSTFVRHNTRDRDLVVHATMNGREYEMVYVPQDGEAALVGLKMTDTPPRASGTAAVQAAPP